jgi:Domain of unknown function (DUF4440)
MNVLRPFTAALASLLLTSAVVNAGDLTSNHDIAQLTSLGCEMGRAYARQDVAAQYVKNGSSMLSIDCNDIEVRLYGNAAVVTGEWTYTVRKPEGDTSRRSRWTSMWTRYSGGWKRHAFQNTWVNPDANQPAAITAPAASGH